MKPLRPEETADVEEEPLGEALRDIEETMPGFARWMYRAVHGDLGHTVLDAGAGLGTYTGLLVEEGHDVISLEYFPPFARHVAQRFGGDPRVTVFQADLGDPAGLPRFPEVDSAICLNVLEHVEDDLRAVRNIRHRVKPGGRLVALVPSYPKLLNSLDRAVGHHRRYNKRQFLDLLYKGGWEVEWCRHFNVFGLPGWFVAGSILKRETPGRDLTRIFERLIPAFEMVENTFVRGRFGLSILASCRRADTVPPD